MYMCHVCRCEYAKHVCVCAYVLIVHISCSGTKQLFSQGMADLLLDACSDYWDGHEVRPLGDEERFVYKTQRGFVWLLFIIS